jgi:hypothetical protein
MEEEEDQLVSRSKLVPFIAMIFDVLDVSLEPLIEPLRERYSWRCVRMMDPAECLALGIASPAVELRPHLGTERYVVHKVGHDIALVSRTALVRIAADRGIPASPERDGFQFRPLRKVLLEVWDEFHLDMPRKSETLHRLFPDWPTIPLGLRCSSRYVDVPRGVVLTPENELCHMRRYMVDRKTVRELGAKRRVIRVRSMPLLWNPETFDAA